MRDQSFQEPVVFYSRGPDGTTIPIVVGSVKAAFKALTSGSLSQIAGPAWHNAFDKLLRALLEPKPETVEEARGALHRLANSSAEPKAADATRCTLH
jgi:hypothetical protein